MERFFFSEYDENEQKVFITGDELTHTRALRLKVGDEFISLDGEGLELKCLVKSITDDMLTGEVIKRRMYGGEPDVKITLAQAFLKSGQLRTALANSIQTGISGFIPIITEKVIGRGRNHNKIMEGLENVARASIKQCGRSIIPKLYKPVDLDTLIKNSNKFEVRLLFTVEEGSQPLSKILPEHHAGDILSVIGPEGGFSDRETGKAEDNGFSLVKLSSRRIKSELAGVVATTQILYHYNDIKIKEGKWKTVFSVK